MLSEKKKKSNKRHDETHFKYRSVKFKIDEFERLCMAVETSGETVNGFMRSAIMEKADKVLNNK